MNETPGFGRATHLSIIWGVTLAVLTTLEWRAIDRDPLGHQPLTPFIQREVNVSVVPENPSQAREFAAEDEPPLRYEVDVQFNGPLFLLCFFGPILLFQGLGWLTTRLRSGA